jgi:hypothetical protein
MDLDFSAFGGKTPTLYDLLAVAEHTLKSLYEAKYTFNGHLKENRSILLFSQTIPDINTWRLTATLNEMVRSFRIELHTDDGLCHPDKWAVEPLRALVYLSIEDTAKKFFEEDIKDYINMSPSMENLIGSGFFNGLAGPYDD